MADAEGAATMSSSDGGIAASRIVVIQTQARSRFFRWRAKATDAARPATTRSDRNGPGSPRKVAKYFRHLATSCFGSAVTTTTNPLASTTPREKQNHTEPARKVSESLQQVDDNAFVDDSVGGATPPPIENEQANNSGKLRVSEGLLAAGFPSLLVDEGPEELGGYKSSDDYRQAPDNMPPPGVRPPPALPLRPPHGVATAAKKENKPLKAPARADASTDIGELAKSVSSLAKSVSAMSVASPALPGPKEPANEVEPTKAEPQKKLEQPPAGSEKVAQVKADADKVAAPIIETSVPPPVVASPVPAKLPLDFPRRILVVPPDGHENDPDVQINIGFMEKALDMVRPVTIPHIPRSVFVSVANSLPGSPCPEDQ